MERNHATRYLRKLLDDNGLRDWHIRLNQNNNKFLGSALHGDKCIVLSAHHVDTHGQLEIEDTIKHTVAHALTPGHGHDAIWSDKAIELGCSNTFPCATYGFDAQAIDAIRSGATLQVEYEEQIIRTPKYTIGKLQDKCPTCGRVAKATKTQDFVSDDGSKSRVITLWCGHLIYKDLGKVSPFHTLAFDGDSNCHHVWGKDRDRSKCIRCGARKLYDFQVDGARKIEENGGRFALFDEQGLGKGIQALAYLKFHKEAWPFLWVTKAATVYPHIKEIIRVLGDEAMPWVIRGGKTPAIPGMNHIASYGVFRHLPNLEQFKRAGIKTIILDECQAIMNPDADRTQAIRSICHSIEGLKLIPTSGTPWKNRGSEFFVVLNLLDPITFHSFENFKKEDCETYLHGRAKKVGGIKKPLEFQKKIAHIAVRRERAEVMPELPLINRTKIICEVPEHARVTYEEEEKGLAALYNDYVQDGTENSFKAQQGYLEYLVRMRQILGLAKVPTTVDYAMEFLEETERKLVIFVHHIKVGQLIFNQLENWCKANGYPQPLQLNAMMDPMERGAIVEKFNSKHYRLLIASTLASGEGLNLQTCSDCVMHERQWNPANEEQAEGRFIRIGQDADSVNAVYVHADDSIDIDLDGIVERKRLQFHNAMNKGKMPIWSQEDIIKDLVAKIAKKRRAA
jgi:hypothetical protein